MLGFLSADQAATVGVTCSYLGPSCTSSAIGAHRSFIVLADMPRSARASL
jgi:hypothetical protein